MSKKLKTILTTFNAKYIHTSLALRWLYVANKERFDISFVEYTIKSDLEQVVDEILTAAPDVIGLSISIWGVEKSRLFCERIKLKNPEITIILGGPEVSYEPEYFLENWPVDYIVSGEGEFVLGDLLHALENDLATDNIPGVSSQKRINKQSVQADIARLAACDSPYQLPEDREGMKNRIIYFETSRGCPYRCQYCLSSLERGVRYFPETHIRENLGYLLENGARRIKFLDRTFNLNKAHTARVFDFLYENYRPGVSCQFEIYADLLDDKVIASLNEKVPANYFRFEIGIQSTYEPTNLEVKRVQNFPLLAHNIRQLMDGGKIDLHLDLIAGLPHENFERFVQSFNDVFELGAKELQLGFLKLLRGTNLRKNAARYGYIYDENAPYEVSESKDISATEMDRIHEAEHALEKFWNSGRFPETMKLIFEKHYQRRYFEFFDEVGVYYKTHNLPHRAYLLEDLFRYLNGFLLQQGIDASETLRDDYYSNFKSRPRGYWEERPNPEESKRALYIIGQDREFLKKHGLTRKIVEKQGVADKQEDGSWLLNLFLQNGPESRRLTLSYQLKSK